jgi:hypothetical protein
MAMAFGHRAHPLAEPLAAADPPEAQRRRHQLPEGERDQADRDHSERDDPARSAGDRAHRALRVRGLVRHPERDLQREPGHEQVHHAVADQPDPAERVDHAARGVRRTGADQPAQRLDRMPHGSQYPDHRPSRFLRLSRVTARKA